MKTWWKVDDPDDRLSGGLEHDGEGEVFDDDEEDKPRADLWPASDD